MSWLLPSGIAVFASTFVLTFVFFHLYTEDRQKFLLIWTAGWLVYLVRHGVMLAMLLSRETALLNTAYHLSALVSGVLLLWGTHVFLGRALSRAWVAGAAAIGIWIAVAIGLELPFYAFAFPNFIFLAFIYVWTGSVFLNTHRDAGGRIVGWAFILWGVHKADYPFLRPLAWFAPVGYIISSILELSVALGMLLVHFQKMKIELVRKEERFRLFAENAQDVIFRHRLSPERRFEYVSPSVTAMLGYTPEEHYADPDLPLKMVHPDDRGILLEAIKDPARHGTFVVRWLHRDGSVVWTEQKNAPLFDEKGNLAAIQGIARNITERKQAEEALRSSEERFRRYFEFGLIGMAITSPAKGIVEVNDKVCELLGYGRNELLRLTWAEITHPDDLALDVANFNRVMAGEINGYSIEKRFIRRDGQVIHAIISVNCLRRADGSVDYFLALMQDITERKMLEEKLRLQFERMPIGFVLTDPEHVILDWNPAAEMIFGYAKREAVGRHIYGFIVPDSVKPVVDELLVDLKKGDRTLHSVNENRTKDGRTITCEWYDTPLRDESGKLIAIMGMVQDITERKRSEDAVREHEKRFREFMENIHLSAVMLDREGRVTFCNDHLLNLTGWSRDEVIGRNWFELFVPADRRAQTKRYFIELIAAEAVPLHHENPIVTRKGEQRLIIWDNTLLRNSDNTIIGTASIGIDVTEHRKLEAQLRQAQKMEAVGQLAGGIAHDFNNIITAVVGYAYLLKVKMEKDHPLLMNVEQILAASEKASTLTHSLLAFSRKQAISIKPVDLGAIVRKMEKLLLRVIGEDIEMRTDRESGPLLALADDGQVEQVLMNLATNARDAMPKGGVLTIHVERRGIDQSFIEARGFGEPGTYALLSVSDTGVGMDETTRGKIFEPFFTTKEMGRGTGLGLAMVYGIVKQHNGFIDVRSEPGKGSAFDIYLPLAAQAGDEAKRTPRKEAEPLPKGSGTILLAEDDDTLRDLSSSVLQEAGYGVIEAGDGEEAVRKFAERKGEIELVILDVVMPKQSGREAAAAIRKLKPSVKVLYVSGYAPDIVRDKGLLQDGSEILLKPFSPYDLLKKAEGILREDMRE